MPTTIKLKNGSGAPTAGQLVQGEPAFDLTNKRLYTEDSGGTVLEIGTNPTSLTTGGLTVTTGSPTGTLASLKGSSGFGFTFSSDASVPYVQSISVGTSEEIAIVSGGNRLALFQDGGDISFYEPTGTTAKLFWDASAESLGIGTSSPSRLAHLYGTTNPTLRLDNGTNSVDIGIATSAGALQTGSGVNDLVIARNGAYNMLFGTNGTERLRIDSSGNVALTGNEQELLFHSNYTVGNTDRAKIKVIGAGGGSGYGGDLTFHTKNPSNVYSERMRVDSSGNVGIGTSSPESFANFVTLEVTGDTSAAGGVYQSSTSDGGVKLRMFTSNNGGFVGTQTNHALIFDTNGTERMRLDTSGNLLVGKTASSIATEGAEFGSGQHYLTTDGDAAVKLNRLTSDGEIAQFRKDGTVVGSIGANGSHIYTGSGDTGLYFDAVFDHIIPWNTSTGAVRDNAIDLGDGGGGGRFKDLYLSGGVYLGGTGAANHLDDYETGTWTPTAGADVTIDSIVYADYVKVGDILHVVAWLKVSPTATAFTINGFPISVLGSRRSTASVYSADGSTPLRNQVLGTTMYAYNGTVGTNRDFIFSVSYQVS